MTTPNDGGWAFPHHGGLHPADDPRNQLLGGGISVRDYFAAKAMAGWLATYGENVDATQVRASVVAQFAYKVADAMLEERKK